MNYVDAEMPCHCEIRFIQDGPIQIKKLCQYHKIDHSDLLISFHNWMVAQLDQLRSTLGNLTI